MVHLQILNLLESLFLIDLEALLPLVVELLHVLVTDLDVLTHLSSLNVASKLVLIVDNLSLEESDFFHKVLVELILVHLAAFFGEQLHFLFDERED